MTTRKELESQGWVYMCCENHHNPENTKQLDKMDIPQEDRFYTTAHRLSDVPFTEAVRENLKEGQYRAVFFKPKSKI